MTERKTAFGTLIIAEKSALFSRAITIAEAGLRKKPSSPFSWALTGGSTPTEFYAWCVAKKTLSNAVLADTHFYVSDERVVPLSSDQSNFGNADREMLTPLRVAQEHKHPWPVDLPTPQALEKFRMESERQLGSGKGFDLCFLGMGDDAHTASFFPGEKEWHDGTSGEIFTVLTTHRGPRFTITPVGLQACQSIVLISLGRGKAAALQQVFEGSEDDLQVPSKILRTCADRVTWLVDEEAASLLKP